MEKRTFVSFDWAIKKILRNKANFAILEGFLSEILGIDLTIQELLESEMNKQNEEDKFNRVDILAKTDLNELILIEVQYDYEVDYFHRMIYGMSKLISEYLHSGQQYGAIKKAYSVNIVYFELGQGKDYLYKYEGHFVGMNDKNDILAPSNAQKRNYNVETIADIFPEYYIIKVGSFEKEEITTGREEWMYFLKKSEIQDTFKAKGMETAKETLKVESMSAEEKKAYERHIDSIRIEKAVTESAEMLGIRKRNIEVAKTLLAEGMLIDFIIKVSKLTLAEIEKLQRGEDLDIY